MFNVYSKQARQQNNAYYAHNYSVFMLQFIYSNKYDKTIRQQILNIKIFICL